VRAGTRRIQFFFADPPGAGEAALWPWMIPLLGFVAVFSWCNATSFDLGWHLKTGEWIAQNRAIPYADPFSFTAAGQPWIAHEWLFGLLGFLVFSAGGIAGLTAAKAALTALACGLAACASRFRGATPGVIAVVLSACHAVSWQRLSERPEVLSLPIALAFVLAAEAGREKPRLLFILPALELAWVNVHGGTALLGLGLSAACLLDRWREARPVAPKGGMSLHIGVFLGVVAASFANPTGIRGLSYGLLRTESPLSNREFESVAVRFNQSPDLSFWMFAAFAIAMTVVLCLRARHVRPSEWLLFGALLVLACIFFRFRSLFVFLLAPSLAAHLSSSGATGRLRKWVPAFVTAGILAGAVGMAMGSYSYRFGAGPHPGLLPVGAADFIRESGLTGRGFNTYGFGGTLIWKLPAGRKVFIDGREDVYVRPGVIREYQEALKHGEKWRAVVERYDLDYAVIEYPEQPPRSPELSPELTHFPRSQWALVYLDDVAVLYVRRNGRNDALIQQRELRWIQPLQLSTYLDRIVRDPSRLEAFEAEVAGQARAHPGSFRLHFLLGVLAVKRGPQHIGEAVAEFEKVVELNPEYAPGHRNLSAVYGRIGRR
jgi:hypothetical protein